MSTDTLIALSIVVGLLSAYAAIEWSLRQDARERQQLLKDRAERAALARTLSRPEQK